MIKVEENGYRSGNYGKVKHAPKKNVVYKRHLSGHQQSFTGKANVAAEGIEDLVRSFMPWTIRTLNFLGGKRGEIQNILINAAGTGLVAPVFIKYNFLSDADEDTRTYSAWRQPLSAFLAIITQAGLTMPFYKKYDTWANNGNFDENMNKTLFQDEDYIRKMLKKQDQYKNATKEELNAAAKAERNRQLQSLRESFHAENGGRPIYRYADGTTKRMSDNTYKNLLTETIDKMLKIDEYALNELDETVKRRTVRSKYYRDNYTEAHQILEELQTNLAGSNSRKELNSYLNKTIKSLKSNSKHSEMVNILKDLKQRAKYASSGKITFSWDDIKVALGEKVDNMLAHAEKYKDVTSDAEVERMVKNTVESDKEKLTELVEYYRGLKSKVTEATSVDEISEQLEALKNKLKLKGSSLDKDFIKELADRLVARTKAHQAWYKQFTGIFVTLAILPFTCTLLNWIYPRFMDIFFPNLSNKKHDNSSAKLVALAPKAALAQAQRPIGEVLKERFTTVNSKIHKVTQTDNTKKAEVA